MLTQHNGPSHLLLCSEQLLLVSLVLVLVATLHHYHGGGETEGRPKVKTLEPGYLSLREEREGEN